ncbi:MAG: ribonuclease III [Elusimicrobiota bacterium]
MEASIEEVLGYRFTDAELLQEALTHKSYAFEQGTERHNERLEFLGDSVLAVVVAHHLFLSFAKRDEGHLSKLKSSLVSRATLARWAEDIGVGRYVFLGSGEETTGGRDRPSILSNAMEAIIGAVYLDGGYEKARSLLHRLFLDHNELIEESDYKSGLQEIVQKQHKVPPNYELVETTGPDHDKTFTVKVRLGSRMMGIGTGKTKKEAEQAAAQDALQQIPRSADGGEA